MHGREGAIEKKIGRWGRGDRGVGQGERGVGRGFEKGGRSGGGRVGGGGRTPKRSPNALKRTQDSGEKRSSPFSPESAAAIEQIHCGALALGVQLLEGVNLHHPR